MSKETADCKCRRLGDYWNGSHHPLCDANWSDEPAVTSDAEPVAWQWQNKTFGTWHFAHDKHHAQMMAEHGHNVRALIVAPAPTLRNVAPSRDAIERSKPILEAVDTYLRRPDRMNRNALRGMIFDEFDELLATSKNGALLENLLSHAWGFDVKWNKEPNTIRNIIIDVRDTTTAAKHHIDHAKALISEFCKTAHAAKEPK